MPNEQMIGLTEATIAKLVNQGGFAILAAAAIFAVITIFEIYHKDVQKGRELCTELVLKERRDIRAELDNALNDAKSRNQSNNDAIILLTEIQEKILEKLSEIKKEK